jgi:hypothetical protein
MHTYIQYIVKGIIGGVVIHCNPQCFFFINSLLKFFWQWFKFVSFYGRVCGYFMVGTLASIELVTSVADDKEVLLTAWY